MNIVSAVKHGFEALRVGKSLTKAEAWKNAQAVTSFLIAVVAVVRACGVDFGIDDSTLAGVGVAIAALVNTYITFATSKKVGFPDKLTPTVEPASVEPIDDQAPNTARAERRTAHHDSMRNPIIPPASVGYHRERYGERMSNNKPAGVERRGQPDLDSAKEDQLVSESGWNNR
jgi:hypothetical protein